MNANEKHGNANAISVALENGLHAGNNSKLHEAERTDAENGESNKENVGGQGQRNASSTTMLAPTMTATKPTAESMTTSRTTTTTTSTTAAAIEETSSTKEFLQKLMTTFGLNSCPPSPPNLNGPIEVDASFEKLEVVEQRYAQKLLPGGWFRPAECNTNNRVAIIIPYRDRANHLPVFLKNIHPFLMKQQIEYGIFVVEQIADGLFNRAALMNVGFVEALKMNDWDCFIFHDIDLLPMDDRNLYTCPDQPRHMSVAVDTMGFK